MQCPFYEAVLPWNLILFLFLFSLKWEGVPRFRTCIFSFLFCVAAVVLFAQRAFAGKKKKTITKVYNKRVMVARAQCFTKTANSWSAGVRRGMKFWRVRRFCASQTRRSYLDTRGVPRPLAALRKAEKPRSVQVGSIWASVLLLFFFFSPFTFIIDTLL